MDNITQRLSLLITQSGKQQTQICKELGIKKQYLSNWKTGFCEPNIDDLIMLAKYFGVTIDYLVGLENEDGTKRP
ncbi:MAG: helix-turn-helix domain-containing protein [Clostridiales bacterium]|jgi:transcriptional regulator with XRE-family HTH domain|nr:helix-turn-helix domain-containing protein [Clostridiales bacterium]